MKKIFTIATIAATFMACNGNKATVADTTKVLSAADSVKMEAFEKWKEQKEEAPKEKTVVVYRELRKPAASRSEAPGVLPPATDEQTSTSAGSMETGTTTTGNEETEASMPTASTEPEVEQKKGWSKAAKGAVIGGVMGAAAGAIIHKKKRGVGAVIGGVVGAGVGYGIGRSKDKKDGRY